MMVQQNQNAIASTLFLYKSPPTFDLDYFLSIFLHKLSDYYPLFSSIYIYIYIYIYMRQISNLCTPIHTLIYIYMANIQTRIYIYIYIGVCVCVCVSVCVGRYVLTAACFLQNLKAYISCVSNGTSVADIRNLKPYLSSYFLPSFTPSTCFRIYRSERKVTTCNRATFSWKSTARNFLRVETTKNGLILY